MSDIKRDYVLNEDRTGSHSRTSSTKELHHRIVVDEIPDPDDGISHEQKRALDRRLVWKMDLFLVPWLSLIYLLCFLDRTNIGNARLAGMEKDLDMRGHDYNLALTIFFISYAGAEPFTNLVLKKITPRVFFSSIVLLWGLSMMCTGLVSSMSGLLVARFFLGITEAGLFPGVQYYLSCWYRKSELGLRLAIFFANAALAGSFGGLLAAAIAHMDGIGGRAGWAWIFIIEGLATMLVGALSWFMVYDWPDTAQFLTTQERMRVRRRLAQDNQSSAGEHYDKRHVVAAILDWKTALYAFSQMGNFMPLYAFSLFLPTIIAGMGHEGTHAQLLTVPPYACAACMTVLIGWVADRSQQRGICNLSAIALAIIGYSMLLASSAPHVQYAGTFLGAMGVYPTIPNSLSWAASNLAGRYKRGVALGIIVGWGNLNGIVSSNIYLKSEKPRYPTGHTVVLVYLVVCHLGGTLLLRLLLQRENGKRRRGERNGLLLGKTDDEIVVAGDRRPDFFYTL